MNQAPLVFDGPAYNHALDGARLNKQHYGIRSYMADGHWRTLREISETLDFPEASVSAQLRHLRKSRFGGHTVNRRRVGGTWEYQVVIS